MCCWFRRGIFFLLSDEKVSPACVRACVCVCVHRSNAYDERVMGPMTTGGDQPDPSFVCERVCTSDRLLKRLGGMAKVRALK